MIHFCIRCFALIFLVSIVACSSNQKNEVSQAYLATHILDDGSKQFVYSAELPEPAGRGKRGGGNGRPGNVAGNVQGSSSRGLSAGVTAGTGGGRKAGKGSRGRQSGANLLVEALESELKKTGYCRKGFMELDRMMEPSQTFIKGECVETASRNDREEFPNDIE
jgi:hypothetical protein